MEKRLLRSAFGINSMIATAIGNIIKAVAVLETHMDRIPVAKRKPIKMRGLECPTRLMIAFATTKWIFHFSRAVANTNPPKNRYTILSPYDWDKPVESIKPSGTPNTHGIKAVT